MISTARLKSKLDKLQAHFGKDANTRIVFSKRITKKEIRSAEKALSIAFPESYTDFVNTHGTFYFSTVDDRGREIGNRFNELMEPSQIVTETHGWMEELRHHNRTGSEIADEVIENFVVFFHHGACDIAVFCPAKKFRREMAVYDVDHDDMPVEWEAPSQKFETFLSGVIEMALEKAEL